MLGAEEVEVLGEVLRIGALRHERHAPGALRDPGKGDLRGAREAVLRGKLVAKAEVLEQPSTAKGTVGLRLNALRLAVGDEARRISAHADCRRATAA